MNIYTLIRTDYLKMQSHMAQIESLSDQQHKNRLALFRNLEVNLLAHNEAKEASFYKALENHPQLNNHLQQMRRQDDAIESAIKTLNDTNIPAGQWNQAFSNLQKLLFQRIENELNDTFSNAYILLTPQDAFDVAIQMVDIKQQHFTQLRKVG